MIAYPMKATWYMTRRHGVAKAPWRNNYPGIQWGISEASEGTDWLYELAPGAEPNPDNEAAWVRIGPLAFTVDSIPQRRP